MVYCKAAAAAAAAAAVPAAAGGVAWLVWRLVLNGEGQAGQRLAVSSAWFPAIYDESCALLWINMEGRGPRWTFDDGMFGMSIPVLSMVPCYATARPPAQPYCTVKEFKMYSLHIFQTTMGLLQLTHAT